CPPAAEVPPAQRRIVAVRAGPERGIGGARPVDLVVPRAPPGEPEVRHLVVLVPRRRQPLVRPQVLPGVALLVGERLPPLPHPAPQRGGGLRGQPVERDVLRLQLQNPLEVRLPVALQALRQTEYKV